MYGYEDENPMVMDWIWGDDCEHKETEEEYFERIIREQEEAMRREDEEMEEEEG